MSGVQARPHLPHVTVNDAGACMEQRGWKPIRVAPAPSTFDSAWLGKDRLEHWRALVNLRDAALQQAAQATASRQQADAELERLGVPEEAGLALRVLLYFAIAGLVFPVVVLARQPTSDWWVLRLAVVVGFVTGLAGLLLFLWRVIRGATGSS